MDAVDHVRAILNTLEAAGVTVGDHVRPSSIPANPSDSGWQRYSILYTQPGGNVTGTADAPDSDYDARFAVVSVGRNAAEARFQADAAHVALADGFSVAGRSIQRVAELGSPAIARDDDVSPPLFSMTRRYGFHSFPS